MKIRVITFLILVVFITLTTSSAWFGMISWLLSISLSVVASLIAAIFSTYMANQIPSPKRLIANIQERFATKQASQSYRIILCDLDHDDEDRRQTYHVASALGSLQEFPWIEVIRNSKKFSFDQYGEQTRAREKVLRDVYEYLNDWNADVLVFGHVAAPDNVLKLSILSRRHAGNFVERPYELISAELPVDFATDLNSVLVTEAISTAYCDNDQYTQQLVHSLKEHESKLDRLVSAPPPDLTDAQISSLTQALTRVCAEIGRREGDLTRLARSEEIQTNAVRGHQAEGNVERLIGAKLNLANIQSLRGQRSSDPAHLQNARRNCIDAISNIDPAQSTMAWAIAQNTHGLVLREIGAGLGDVETLRESANSFQRSIETFLQVGNSMEANRVKQNLGLVLTDLGEISEDAQLLRSAITQYRELLESVEVGKNQDFHDSVLEVMASAMRAAVEIEARGENPNPNAQPLEESIKILRRLSRSTQKRASPYALAKRDDRLGRSLSLLSNIYLNKVGQKHHPILILRRMIRSQVGFAEGSKLIWNRFRFLPTERRACKLAQEAYEMSEKAAKYFEEKRLNLDWAAAQLNLSGALSLLGYCTGSVTLREQGVDACKKALLVYSDENQSMLWMKTSFNLGDLLRGLADEENSSERAEEAVEVYQNVLRHLSRDEFPTRWAEAAYGIGICKYFIGLWRQDLRELEGSIDHLRNAFETYRRLGISQGTDHVGKCLQRAQTERDTLATC